MSFPRKFLNEGEDVVLDLRPHWWFLAGPVAAIVAAVAFAAFATTTEIELIGWLALATVLAALLWLGVRYLRWTTTSFVVTSDRLIYRHGVLAKRGIEIPLERVNNIAFGQTLFERMLGAGDLLIESAGESGQQRFTDVRRPSRVQNVIYRAMEDAAARDADRRAGGHQLSIPEQIEKLDELRQRGIVSQAEFEAKKAQLLDRL